MLPALPINPLGKIETTVNTFKALDVHTRLRVSKDISALFSDAVANDFAKATDFLIVPDFLQDAAQFFQDITFQRSVSLKEFTTDALAATSSATGFALFLHTAGLVNVLVFVGVGTLGAISLGTAAAFFAIKTYDTFVAPDLTQKQVTELFSKVSKKVPNTGDVDAEKVGLSEAKAKKIAEAKNGQVEWTMCSNAAKTTLLAAPFFGSAIPAATLLALAFIVGATTILSKYNELGIERAFIPKDLKKELKKYEGDTKKREVYLQSTLRLRHTCEVIKSSNNFAEMKTKADANPQNNSVFRMSRMAIDYFKDNSRSVVMSAGAVCSLAELKWDFTLHALKSSTAVEVFYGVMDLPGNLLKMKNLSKTYNDAGSLEALQHLSGAVSNYLKCAQWLDGLHSFGLDAIWSDYFLGDIKSAASILSLLLRTKGTLSHLFFSDARSLKELFDIFKNAALIALVASKAWNPVLKAIPDNKLKEFIAFVMDSSAQALDRKGLEKTFTNVIGAFILLMDSFSYVASKRQAYNEELSAYKRATKVK